MLILFVCQNALPSKSDSIKKLLSQSFHYSKSNSDSALMAVNLAMKLATQTGNDTLMADTYLEMSYIQFDLGQVDSAVSYAFKALRTYEQCAYAGGMANAYCRIAWDKLDAGEHDIVFPYLYKALELALVQQDSSILARVYHMLGAAYNWTNKYGNDKTATAINDSFYMWIDSALHYNRKTVAIRRSLNDRGLSNSLNNLGMVLQRQALYTGENFEEAENVYLEVLKIRQENNDYVGISASYTNLANLERYRGNYQKALHYAHKGRKLADNFAYPFHMKLNVLELSKIHEELENYDSALIYARQYHNLQTQSISVNHKNAIKEMETRYEVSKKDAAISLHQKELRLQRFYLLFSLMGTGILVMISIVFFRLYHKNKQLSSHNELLIREQNHRIKNNLQIISGLLSLQANRTSDHFSRDAIEASQARVEAMSLIHKKLYINNFSTIRVDEYIKELAAQILISAGIHLTKKEFELSNLALKADTVTSLGLILNELLINSCKHAFQKTANPELYISFETRTDGKRMLRFKDNGPGFDPAVSNKNPQSFGLKLIHLQVLQLQGSYQWERNGGMIFKAVF